MIAVGDPFRRRSDLGRFVSGLHSHLSLKRGGTYLLRCVAVAGVLAFMFSAVSPDDDLDQQEVVHSRKFAQFLGLRSKVIRCSAAADRLLTARRLSSSPSMPGTWVRLVRNPSILRLQILPDSPAGQRPPPSLHS
jgi:hypothetical protein